MKNTLLLFAVIFSSGFCFSQSLVPTVVGSAGASGTSASGNIDWTVGEIMTETFSSGNIITQGFHQPWTNLTTSVSNLPAVPAFDVYPNPVSDYLKIHFSGAGSYSLNLYDAQGRIVFSGSAEDLPLTVIPVADLDAGLYFLSVYDTGSNTRESFTISKTK
ncbi:MAG: T9SS type A sorting domain-containing protein [Bacteroidia bacterium]